MYGRSGTLAALEAARSEPRALFRWREMEQQSQLAQREALQRQLQSFLQFRFPGGPGRFPVRGASNLHADWSVSLGGGSTAVGQYPAKFTFDTTAAITIANCTSDFAVFPINVAGTATQANIVALDNLYSGTANGTTPNGLCNTVLAATVIWGYNIDGVGGAATTKTNTAGAVPISPVLSLDGTKVALVESAAGSVARFHVLAPASEGTVGAPIIFGGSTGRAFSTTAPVASGGNGAATDLALGSSTTGTDTLSSPYVDYAHDTAYVGNDAGVLFRIKNVFCTTASCGNASPSLDTTWGTGGTGSVSVCTGQLTGPVQDFYTQNVFVGCSDGKIYGFTSTGAALTIPSIAVGNGSATGGVVESPIVDGGNGVIYAVSGTGATPNTGSAVLIQAHTDLSAVRVATIGGANLFSMHAPAMNDAYFSSATSTNWVIYAAAYDAGGANLVLYGATFDTSRNMTTGTPTNTNSFGTRVGEYAPLTEFKGTNDWLFNAVLLGPTNLGRSNLNTLATFAAGVTNPATGTIPNSSTGLTGMVVDNASGSAQAASIYFGSRGSNTAIKLTQAGLQ